MPYTILAQNSGMFLLASFWKKLELWDQTVLFHINQVWQNSFLDTIMPWMRDSVIWLPLYLFFITLVFYNFGKKGFYWLLFFIATIALSDQTSSNLIKHAVARVRPCNDPFMLQYLKLRVSHCSGGFSFTSSHAANHFGMAMYIVSTLKVFTGKRINWLFVWAGIICYAQMYVGVHYPLDIAGGTIVGLISGWITSRIFKHFVNLQLENNDASINLPHVHTKRI
jgi:membrane-associated phospholipid phosphatase